MSYFLFLIEKLQFLKTNGFSLIPTVSDSPVMMFLQFLPHKTAYKTGLSSDLIYSFFRYHALTSLVCKSWCLAVSPKATKIGPARGTYLCWPPTLPPQNLFLINGAQLGHLCAIGPVSPSYGVYIPFICFLTQKLGHIKNGQNRDTYLYWDPHHPVNIYVFELGL